MDQRPPSQDYDARKNTTATGAVADTDAYRNDTHRKKGWLMWLLIPLILIGLIAYTLAHKDSEDGSKKSNATSTTSSQTATSLKVKFNQSIAQTDRTFYFNPDVTDLQDTTKADTDVAKIVAFYKANSGTKLTVNGSVFDGEAGKTGEPLAMQRAELIKQKLVAAGINVSDIKTSAVNTYTGQTDTAKAEYARSVTVSAQ